MMTTAELERISPIILLSDADEARRAMVKAALQRLSQCPVTELATPDDLERELERRSASLVIASARLGDSSALQSLARARSAGFHAPFIVYTALSGALMRVLVNGGDGTVLSSRVVDLTNFADLAQVMLSRERISRIQLRT